MPRNYVNEGLQTYAIVDGIFQRQADREQQNADRERQQRREDEQDSWRREDRQRQQAIRTNTAELYRREQALRELTDSLAPEIGSDAGEYLDPTKRQKDRPLLGEAFGRLKAGKLTDDFLLHYFNTVYESQINRGTGGSRKRAVKLGQGPSGKGFVVGLDVDGHDGKTRREMMTVNRGTREEDDNEVKEIPVRAVVHDNLARQIIVDAFDRHGVGEGNNHAEEVRKARAAIAEVKAKLLELGDASVAERDRADAKEARTRQQAREDSDRSFMQDVALAGIGQQQALDLEGSRHSNALELAGVNNTAAAERTRIAAAGKAGGGNDYTKEAVKKSLDNYYKMRQNWVSAKAGGTITYIDEFGQPKTKQATYKDIAVLEQAMEAEMRFLQSAGVFARSEAPGQQPPPSQPGAAGGQQAGTQPQQGGQQPPGVPDGTVLGKPIQKNGQMVYPVLDGKTGRPVINPQTGKPMGYIPNRS